jgi:hypothetical protein
MCVCVDREGWGEQEQATHRQQQTERESILLQRLMTSDDIRDKFNRVPVVSHEKSEGGIRMANVFDEETDGTAEDREGRGLEPFLHLHSSHQQPTHFDGNILHIVFVSYISRQVERRCIYSGYSTCCVFYLLNPSSSTQQRRSRQRPTRRHGSTSLYFFFWPLLSRSFRRTQRTTFI